MNPILLVVIFIVSAIVGFKIISNVPSLLHTPLMTAMNALAGIALIGALTSTAAAVYTGNKILGIFAVFIAMVNIAGGFGLSDRMLKMFKGEEADSE